MARVVLGLSDQQFYRLTPRQFHLMLDQHRERVRHQEWMTGIIAATTANFSMQPPKEPLKPADFMPSSARPAKAKTPRRVNRTAVADKVRAFLTQRMQEQQCQPNA